MRRVFAVFHPPRSVVLLTVILSSVSLSGKMWAQAIQFPESNAVRMVQAAEPPVIDGKLDDGVEDGEDPHSDDCVCAVNAKAVGRGHRLVLEEGDEVLAGSVVVEGRFYVKVTRIGKDLTIARRMKDNWWRGEDATAKDRGSDSDDAGTGEPGSRDLEEGVELLGSRK